MTRLRRVGSPPVGRLAAERRATVRQPSPSRPGPVDAWPRGTQAGDSERGQCGAREGAPRREDSTECKEKDGNGASVGGGEVTSSVKACRARWRRWSRGPWRAWAAARSAAREAHRCWRRAVACSSSASRSEAARVSEALTSGWEEARCAVRAERLSARRGGAACEEGRSAPG